MENLMPKPLRIVKHPRSRKRTVSSASTSFYPRIPCRQSSLQGHSRQFSDESITSRTTPPPNYGFLPLVVPKNRQSDTQLAVEPRQAIAEDFDLIDIPKGQETDTQTYRRPSSESHVSRFFSGWSFRSWSSTMRRLSLDLENRVPNKRLARHVTSRKSSRKSSGNSYEVSDAHQSSNSSPSRIPSGFQKPERLAPRSVSITNVDIKTATNPSTIDIEPVSVWVTVDVTANIGSEEPLSLEQSMPLDVVVILDSLPRSFNGLLRQQMVGLMAIVSNLIPKVDRYAIAYVDANAKEGFGFLLHLGMHSVESAQIAVDKYSTYRLTRENNLQSELQDVIWRLSGTFCYERMALCHIFFITASPTHFQMPGIDKRIGFHTIAPISCFPFDGPSIPSGWHIFCDMNIPDADSREAALRSKLRTVLYHLHAGTDPGIVTNLDLSFMPGDSCEIQSLLEGTQLPTLRPGEKWTVPVQISVPAASSISSRSNPKTTGSSLRHSHTALEDLINQVHHLLTDYSLESVMQHIMTARLDYNHSLLPIDSAVHLESRCTVARSSHEDSTTVWDM